MMKSLCRIGTPTVRLRRIALLQLEQNYFVLRLEEIYQIDHLANGHDIGVVRHPQLSISRNQIFLVTLG